MKRLLALLFSGFLLSMLLIVPLTSYAGDDEDCACQDEDGNCTPCPTDDQGKGDE